MHKKCFAHYKSLIIKRALMFLDKVYSEKPDTVLNTLYALFLILKLPRQ